MKKFIIFAIFVALISGCTKKIDEKNPVDVAKHFLLLCEEGNINEAQKLLSSDNDLDYFRKYKDMGKDMVFIGYDYKGDDNILKISYKLDTTSSNSKEAYVMMTTDYLLSNEKFDKQITLKKEGDVWRIKEFLFMPVKVKREVAK